MKVTIKQKYKGLNPFETDDLPSVTIVTGVNGSGKSQLLSLIQMAHQDAQTQQRMAEHEGWPISDSISIDPKASLVITGGMGGGGANMQGGYESERQSLRRAIEDKGGGSRNRGQAQLDGIRSELGLSTSYEVGYREIDAYLEKKHLSGIRWQQGVGSAIEAYFRRLEEASLAEFRKREYGLDDESAMTAEQFHNTYKSPYVWINRMLDKVGSPYKLEELTPTQYS